MSLVQNHQVNVLVVDPDVEVRGQIHEVLIADGFGCRAVSSAVAAVEAAREKIPSLLICDMNLGSHTGVDLLRSLRSIVECPAIFVSDSRDPSMVRLARKAGAMFYLSKPLDTDVLIELVDKSLWMPHLVRRHVASATHAPHQVKAPTFTFGAANTPTASK